MQSLTTNYKRSQQFYRALTRYRLFYEVLAPLVEKEAEIEEIYAYLAKFSEDTLDKDQQIALEI